MRSVLEIHPWSYILLPSQIELCGIIQVTRSLWVFISSYTKCHRTIASLLDDKESQDIEMAQQIRVIAGSVSVQTQYLANPNKVRYPPWFFQNGTILFSCPRSILPWENGTLLPLLKTAENKGLGYPICQHHFVSEMSLTHWVLLRV